MIATLNFLTMTWAGGLSVRYSILFMPILMIQVFFKVESIFYPGLRSHIIDEVMPANDSPAIIVARFLKANSFDEVRTGTISTGDGLLDRRSRDSTFWRDQSTFEPTC